MSPPSRRDDPTNPFARHNPWGAPGPGVMRVGPLPSAAPPKPARPAAVQRPITAPARGGRGGVLTGSALPLPTSRPAPQVPAPQAPAPQPPAPRPATQAPLTQPPIATPPPARPALVEAPLAETPVPAAAAPAASRAGRDWKGLLKSRTPVLAGVGYVVLVAASAVFLLPMRPEHDGGPEDADAPTAPAGAQTAAAPAAAAQPIRAAVARIDAPSAVTPEVQPAPAAPEPKAQRAVAVTAPTPKTAAAKAATEPPAEPEPRPLIVAQNATPIETPPLPERAPTVPPPTQDPDAPMVTRLPEMR